MNSALEETWKDEIFAEFRILSLHLLGRTEENTKSVRIAGLLEEF